MNNGIDDCILDANAKVPLSFKRHMVDVLVIHGADAYMAGDMGS